MGIPAPTRPADTPQSIYGPGGDCPPPTHTPPHRKGLPYIPPPVEPRRPGRPAYGARLIPGPPGKSTSKEDEPSPPGTPTHTTGGTNRTESPDPRPYTLTAFEQTDLPGVQESSPLTEFSDFLPVAGGGTARPGQFASAQLQDLKHALSHVLAHDS